MEKQKEEKMTQFNSNALVEYITSSGTLSVGNASIGDYYPWWQDYHHYYHYSYPVYIDNKSKIEQAFKITEKLMEKKIVKDIKLKQFIELVKEIASVL